MTTAVRSVRAIIVVLAVAGLVSVAPGRTWTSRNGKFTVEATLVEFKDGKVKLKKADGGEISVPLAQLCDGDQQFVKEQSSPGEDAALGVNDEQREWTSRDGKFTIHARLLDYRQGKVRLRKADGKEIEVPIGVLSEEDRRWVSDEMRHRRQSANKAGDKDDEPEDDEKEETRDDEGEAEPASADEKPITESLGARTVDLNLVALKLPTGRKKRMDSLTEYLVGMINPQTILWMGEGKNPYEEQFRKLATKEPTYEAKEPHRGVARFGSAPCVFALDAIGKNPKGYNRLYIDANGNGDLTDDKPIDTKEVQAGGKGSGPQSWFPKVEVTFDVDGVKVEGVFCANVGCLRFGSSIRTGVSFRSAAVRDGQIDLGGRKIRLLLVDNDSNGRFDDRVVIRKGGRQLGLRVGDVFFVNPRVGRRGSRAGGSPTDYLFVNRSVCIGGHFYKMDVTPSGDRLKLEPVELAMGYVANASPAYRAVVYSDDYGVLMIGGTANQKIALPEGEWKLASYTLNAPSTGRPTVVTADFPSDTQAVKVKKGETAELPLGAPFRAVVTASRSGTKVSLLLAIVGAGGEQCRSFFIRGERPPKPVFEVVDKDGKVVHTGKFEYG